MAGFLSLLIMNTKAIHDLAFFASLGILLAGAVTWYFLPLVLTGGIKLAQPKKHTGHLSNQIKKVWGVPSFIILAVLIAVSIFGVQHISTDFNQLMIFKQNTGVYKSFKSIMEVNGGSIPVYVNISTDDDPLSPKYGQAVLDFEHKIEQSGYASKTLSVYDIFALASSNITGKNLDHPIYPFSMITVNMMSSMILKGSSTGEVTPAAQMVNRDEKAARIVVFPKDLKDTTLDYLSSAVAEFNKSNNSMTAQITGAESLMRELNQNMMKNQYSSIGLAFILIFLLLFISLRKIIPTLVSMIPIAFTTFTLFGFMGLTGISLNLFTATIFSITIGVGIDYAVHYTSVWLYYAYPENSMKNSIETTELKSNGSHIDGLANNSPTERALKYTGRPIIANALGLSIGLSALLLSPLRIHMYVSVLMWTAMLSSVFLSLSLLPTILRWIKK